MGPDDFLAIHFWHSSHRSRQKYFWNGAGSIRLDIALFRYCFRECDVV